MANYRVRLLILAEARVVQQADSVEEAGVVAAEITRRLIAREVTILTIHTDSVTDPASEPLDSP